MVKCFHNGNYRISRMTDLWNSRPNGIQISRDHTFQEIHRFWEFHITGILNFCIVHFQKFWKVQSPKIWNSRRYRFHYGILISVWYIQIYSFRSAYMLIYTEICTHIYSCMSACIHTSTPHINTYRQMWNWVF